MNKSLFLSLFSSFLFLIACSTQAMDNQHHLNLENAIKKCASARSKYEKAELKRSVKPRSFAAKEALLDEWANALREARNVIAACVELVPLQEILAAGEFIDSAQRIHLHKAVELHGAKVSGT